MNALATCGFALQTPAGVFTGGLIDTAPAGVFTGG
jgi:hypothetical protein